MIILTAVFATTFGLVRFGRGAWLGDMLHRVLVERPAESLSRSPVAMAAFVVAAFMLAGFAAFAPELIPLAAAVDFTLAVELAALVFVARATGWARVAGVFVLNRLKPLAGRLVRASARRRRHRSKPRRPGAAQDDPEAWHVAFARATGPQLCAA
ncbi:MAG: hypothetical protein JF570_07645 [Caulobacter sp.]|nr:hypothetical protein [Caulobacter sp.]